LLRGVVAFRQQRLVFLPALVNSLADMLHDVEPVRTPFLLSGRSPRRHR
jgi:hypothetical protein